MLLLLSYYYFTFIHQATDRIPNKKMGVRPLDPVDGRNPRGIQHILHPSEYGQQIRLQCVPGWSSSWWRWRSRRRRRWRRPLPQLHPARQLLPGTDTYTETHLFRWFPDTNARQHLHSTTAAAAVQCEQQRLPGVSGPETPLALTIRAAPATTERLPWRCRTAH